MAHFNEEFMRDIKNIIFAPSQHTFFNFLLLPFLLILIFAAVLLILFLKKINKRSAKKNSCQPQQVCRTAAYLKFKKFLFSKGLNHPGNPGFENYSDKSLPRSSLSLLLKIAVVLSCIILFFSGWLSNFSLYVREPGSTFKALNEIYYKKDKSVLIAEGRISSHIWTYPGQHGFFFDLKNIKITDAMYGTEKIFEFNDTVYIRVKTSRDLFFERDDFLKFSFIPVEKEKYQYLLTYNESIEPYDPNTSGCSSFFEKLIYGTFGLRQRFYRCLSKIFYNSLKYEHAALCEAIILGNKNNLPEHMIEDFRKSGIYHLLAISGMHISFFIFIACLILSAFLNINAPGKPDNKKAGFIFMFLIILLIILYNFIIGQKASALRASLMAMFVIFAKFAERDYSKKYILSISFTFLLIVNPIFFADTGFWLSFASMFAIVYTNDIYKTILENLKKKLKKRVFSVSDNRKPGRNYFTELAITTVSVNIFIFPAVVYFFGEFSLLSLPLNIIAVPLFYILLFILIAASFSGLFWPPFGIFVIKPAQYIIIMLLKISKLWKNLDFAIVELKNFKILHLILYYFILFSALIFLYFVFKNKKRHKNIIGYK